MLKSVKSWNATPDVIMYLCEPVICHFHILSKIGFYDIVSLKKLGLFKYSVFKKKNS